MEVSGLRVDSRRATVASGMEAFVSFVGSFYPASFDCSSLVAFEAVEKVSMVPEGFDSVTVVESVDGAMGSEMWLRQIH